MTPTLILTAGHTQALEYACYQLQHHGYACTQTPSPDVTHLLLPVPSLEPGGTVKGGAALAPLLAQLPENITVIGGNLDHPSLEPYRKADLLQDPRYLAINARITAYCALSLAMDALPCTPDSTSFLVIGWGRIGKCLAQLLTAIGAKTTVAARKESDRAMLAAFGIQGIPIGEICPERYGVIFNTAPEMILPCCSEHPLKIDLASKPGIGGKNVIWARGLPNRLAPESSGRLIAESVISYLSETEAIT